MVVLPAPFGPMIVKTCPGSTLKLTPSRARMPPKLMRDARPRRTSPQALRSHVRLLALEGRVLVERERREEERDLPPAAVDAERLEQDEEHEDQAEDAGLEPG